MNTVLEDHHETAAGLLRSSMPGVDVVAQRERLECIIARWSEKHGLPLEIDEFRRTYMSLSGQYGARQTLEYRVEETDGRQQLVIFNMINDRYGHRGLMTLLQANLMHSNGAERIRYWNVGSRGRVFVHSLVDRGLLTASRLIPSSIAGELGDIEALVNQQAVESYMSEWVP